MQESIRKVGIVGRAGFHSHIERKLVELDLQGKVEIIGTGVGLKDTEFVKNSFGDVEHNFIDFVELTKPEPILFRAPPLIPNFFLQPMSRQERRKRERDFKKKNKN